MRLRTTRGLATAGAIRTWACGLDGSALHVEVVATSYDLTFTVDGGLEQGRRFLDAVRMCSLTANLGDTRTIVTHPASTTHAKLTEEERLAVGITPGLIRISVGLEDLDDIEADVLQALAASR